MANPREIDKEDRSLRDLGFNPDAPPSEAVEKLRELRGNRDVSDVAIARALGAVADPKAAQMLAEMEVQSGGALRREVRRSLFRLRQRGIEPVAAAVPESAPAPAGPSVEPGLSALLSPVDAEGTRIVWLLKSRPNGGVIRLWGLVSETMGLLGVRTDRLSRRELRDERKEMETRSESKFVEADPRLADFILCEAYRNTPESRRSRVGEFFAVRAEMTAMSPPMEFTHPVYAELASELDAEPSMDLLNEPEIAALRFPPDELTPYIEEMSRAQESVLVVSRASQEERMLAVLERAASELLTGERAQRVRRHLEDAAYYMLRDGRRQAAIWAAAASSRIRENADLKQVPFFGALIRKELATLVAEDTERQQAEPRLIMTPAEAMRARQEREARMRRR